ncbi:hypothetical protein [Deferrisoma camini]|uniref:hypothetical protein n=1 Tax=Deferrisoma camini TaxID=1035120 RepID=UPI00046CDA17|nr:hypothetical protein [Deferrisoma camini]
MKRWYVGCVVMLALGGGGCAGLPVAKTTEPTPEPPKVQESQPAPEPQPPKLDPQEERRLVSDLLRDVDEYYRLLKEKNVEQAAGYVDPEHRQEHIDSLWEFAARYEIVSADVASYQLFAQPDGVLAKVRVVRVLLPRHSVMPERSEVWMTWLRVGERWVLQPQRQK